jgi:hypothetical protein
MAKNAIVLKLKAANYYSSSRPCHLLLADGTQAGITAGKNTGAGSTLLSLLAPDGSSDVVNWKTAPVSGGARSTLYSCSTQNTAIGSITGYYYIETPAKITIGLETGGASPIANGHCIQAGEVMLALDTALGESTSLGNTDGLTQYGMLLGALIRSSGTANLGNTTNPQSRMFIGANATPRIVIPVDVQTNNYTSTLMDPAPFGTGKFLIREFAMKIVSGHRVGELAWTANCVDSPHWSALTINAATHRVAGVSTTLSHGIETPYRKNGAAADTLHIVRVTGTWAAWTDLLQAIWDDIGANGTFWQQDTSA